MRYIDIISRETFVTPKQRVDEQFTQEMQIIVPKNKNIGNIAYPILGVPKDFEESRTRYSGDNSV